MNLKSYAPGLTIDQLKEKLRASFEEVYGLKARILEISELDKEEIRERAEKFSSWDWIYGRTLAFQYELSKRFVWGQITLQFQVKNGKVRDVNVFSDSMKPEFIERLRGYLKNIRYDKHAICVELGLYWSSDKEEERMMADIIEWIKTEEL